MLSKSRQNDPIAPTPERMLSQARLALETHGAETTQLMSEYYAIAITSPRDMRDALKDDTSIASAGLTSTIKDLAYGPSPRSLAVGAVAGIALGGAALWSIGSTKYDMDKFFQHGRDKTMHVEGRQIFARNTLIHDSSLLPESMTDSIPVIGSTLKHIPGVPDFGRVVLRQTVTEKRPVAKKHISLASKYVAGRWKTGVAPDLKLNGSEYKIGRRTVSKLLDDHTPKSLSIDRISITGLASDDFAGRLGKLDPEQQELAMDRARTTSKAVADELKSEGYKQPQEVDIDGYEVVLSPAEQRKIRKAADPKLTANEAVNRYETKQKLPKKLTKILGKLIGSNQGANIHIDATERKLKPVKVYRDTPFRSEDFVDRMPGETIFGISALAGTLLAAYYGSMFSPLLPFGRGRKAHRRAKKIIKKAGIDI